MGLLLLKSAALIILWSQSDTHQLSEPGLSTDVQPGPSGMLARVPCLLSNQEEKSLPLPLTVKNIPVTSLCSISLHPNSASERPQKGCLLGCVPALWSLYNWKGSVLSNLVLKQASSPDPDTHEIRVHSVWVPPPCPRK